MKQKVFCIGLSKTGTTSLSEAMKILGYKTSHFPLGCFKQDWKGRLRLLPRKVEKFDCISDLPPAAFFRELDKKFPCSKFILTKRDKKRWLDSCRRHFWWGQLVPEWWPFKDKIVKLHYKIYNSKEFDEKKFSRAYDRHLKSVKEYFKNRDDLLIMKITEGEGWDKLCSFLGEEKPGVPFPKKDRWYSRVFNKLLKFFRRMKGFFSAP